MRPKKKVLIVTPDPVKACLLRFQIDVWGHAPMTADSAAAALEMLEKYEIDAVVICDQPQPALVRTVQESYRFTNVVTIGQANVQEDLADFTVPDSLPPAALPAVLREKLRMATCRKRGPVPHCAADVSAAVSSAL